MLNIDSYRGSNFSGIAVKIFAQFRFCDLHHAHAAILLKRNKLFYFRFVYFVTHTQMIVGHMETFKHVGVLVIPNYYIRKLILLCYTTYMSTIM